MLSLDLSVYDCLQCVWIGSVADVVTDLSVYGCFSVCGYC